MTKKYTIFFAILAVSFGLNAQNTLPAFQNADSLLLIGNYAQAATALRHNIALKPVNYTDKYNLACVYATLGYADSSFYFLDEALSEVISADALTDPDFIPLWTDFRWPILKKAILKRLHHSIVPILDIAYAETLYEMLAKDQIYYKQIQLTENEYGKRAKEADFYWSKKDSINKKNVTELELLIDQKGWPLISQVGTKAASAAFLVIQHSTTKLQKKYLPVIESLAKAGEAMPSSYAYMYDRVQLANNKPQRYGTQVIYNNNTKAYEVGKLENKDKTNDYRKEMGMGSLEDYLKNFSAGY